MRKLRAFTLVELLVVIGIIALLISILLPSLARARQAAVTLQCAANLRTIGQGLMMYADDTKGYWPYGWAQQKPALGLNNDLYWYTTIANSLGAATTNPWDSATNSSMKYFQCGAVNVYPPAAWIPVCNYGGHPVVFGTYFWGTSILQDPTKAPGNGGGVPGLYKAVWMQKNGTEKCIIWDASVDTAGNAGWAFPGSGNVNGDQFWWGTYLVDEPGVWNGWTGRPGTFGQNMASLNGAWQEKAVAMGNPDTNPAGNRASADHVTGNGSMDTYRFRHNGNTACNFLFGDGHVETRRATRQGLSLDQGTTDLINLNFACPYPVAGLLPQN